MGARSYKPAEFESQDVKQVVKSQALPCSWGAG